MILETTLHASRPRLILLVQVLQEVARVETHHCETVLLWSSQGRSYTSLARFDLL